jgi:hypothetical protein
MHHISKGNHDLLIKKIKIENNKIMKITIK